MTRVGKIARLSRPTRDELNHRLDNGEVGSKLLEWLNSLPEVKQVLAANFDSRPITKQNLSEWTRGGFKAWLRAQEARDQVQILSEQSTDLQNDASDLSIADRITTLLSVQLLAETRQLDDIKDPKERRQRMKDLLYELHRLRREDHHAARVRLAREEWEIRRERQYALDRKAHQKWKKKRLLKWLNSLRTLDLKAMALGGDADACKWALWLHAAENGLELSHDIPLPEWYFDDMDLGNNKPDCQPITPEPDEGEPVAPKSDEGGSEDDSSLGASKQREDGSEPPSSQAESNQVQVSPSKSDAGQAGGAALTRAG